MDDFPGGTAALSSGSPRRPGTSGGEQGAEAGFPGVTASAPLAFEVNPHRRRPDGPFYVGDASTVELIEGEHGINADDPLACRGPHPSTVAHPCYCLRWATNYRVAERRAELVDGGRPRAVFTQ